MIIPQSDYQLINIYRCGICSGYFLAGDGNTSCLVLHGPGSCCHHGEKELTLERVRKINSVIHTGEP